MIKNKYFFTKIISITYLLNFLILISFQNILYSDNPTNKINFYLGFEISELMQNNFQNLGLNNFTFQCGQILRFNNWEKFGWDILIINVELNTLHLSDTNFVIGIEGNRSGLKGNLFLVRAYFDWFIDTLKFYFVRFDPVISVGIGYNNFIYSKTYYNYIYDLKTLNLCLSFKIKTMLFDFLYIQFPYFDLFLNVLKNRDVSGYIGDAYINRSEYFGIFSWIGIGFFISIP